VGTSHPRDFSIADLQIPVTKILGSRDGVSPVAKSETNKHLLPASTRWVMIEGGNHSQFGLYGFQPGDRFASIDRTKQQSLTVEAILSTIRAVVQENRANKAPEPTPGSVTPRAIEGASKWNQRKRNEFLHAARQLPAWLIFDVRQNCATCVQLAVFFCAMNPSHFIRSSLLLLRLSLFSALVLLFGCSRKPAEDAVVDSAVKQYDRVQTGMSKQEVVTLLGEPSSRQDDRFRWAVGRPLYSASIEVKFNREDRIASIARTRAKD
jgi:hypothetical protein